MAVYSLVFVAAILSASALLYIVSARSLVREVDARLSAESEAVIGGAGSAAGNGADLAIVAGRVARHEALRDNNDLAYLLVDRGGRRLAGQLRMRLPRPGFSDVDYTDGIEGIDHGRALAARLGDGSTLLIVADYGPIEDLNARLLQIGAIALSITIAIGVLGGFALSRAIGRRIEATAAIAASIMRGELDKRMPFDGTGGAFDRQAAVLNAMLDRIQSLMIHLQQVSSEVAHDLRTPLARLRQSIAALAAAAPAPVPLAALDRLLAQSDDLLALFKAILRISEIEAGSRRAFFARVDLAELARELVATFAGAIAARGAGLAAGDIAAATIEGDRELLAQALINLIDNAAKHGGAGTAIRLAVRTHAATIEIAVHDDGPGIAAADRATALRRFGRLDASRSRPGNGLGLSLVDAIARLHGGEFRLDDGDGEDGGDRGVGGGLTAVIALPLPRAA